MNNAEGGRRQKAAAVLSAVLAAVLYALNMPLSRMLLVQIPSTTLAGLLYLGAGIGTGIMFAVQEKQGSGAAHLTKEDFPCTVGMVVLDILAPVFLMYGLAHIPAGTASLLNNFEIAATAVIALLIFGERVSGRLWVAVGLVTVSSMLLSLEDVVSLQFSRGSLSVLLAAVCWGFENNCTRAISEKNTSEIVTIKGLCSGTGSLLLGRILGEQLPSVRYVLPAMLLGYVAYGLSIFFYIRAQKDMGAARTSACYAIAPFVGALLSFVLLKEPLSAQYMAALLIMMAGSALVAVDALAMQHEHSHVHVITHTHDGTTHTHVIVHSHLHTHIVDERHHHHVHGACVRKAIH